MLLQPCTRSRAVHARGHDFHEQSIWDGSLVGCFAASWRWHALLLSLSPGTNLDIDDDLAVADAAGIEDTTADTAVIGIGILVVQVDNLAYTYLRQDLGTVVARE